MDCLVADDHPLVLSGLRQIVESLGEVNRVLEAVSFPQVLQILGDNPSVGLALLDLSMPGAPGLEGVGRIRAKHPTVAVVVISANEDPQVVRAALAGGAMGFIPKSVSGKVVASALRLVLAGERYVPQGWLMEILERSHPRAARAVPVLTRLTERQNTVLSLLCRGLANAEIASELGIAEQTVKNHLRRIYKSLGVKTRAQAVMKANSAPGED